MSADYEYFKLKIKQKTGINLTYYKEKQMKRRIDSLVKRNNCTSYEEYLKLLEKSKEHFEEFINYLTINVSEFFRNKAQWVILEKKIIPLLLDYRKKDLKIWSAACSTGEEPYSVVMLLTKFLDLSFIRILATDLDKNALIKAQIGEYSAKALENLPVEFKKYFILTDNNTYKIDERIKQCVTFKQHDLLQDDFPANCDLILCRNVMIYFTEDAKNLLYRKLYDALSPEGVLFVGSTEQIIMSNKYGFYPIENFFYKKA